MSKHINIFINIYTTIYLFLELFFFFFKLYVKHLWLKACSLLEKKKKHFGKNDLVISHFDELFLQKTFSLSIYLLYKLFHFILFCSVTFKKVLILFKSFNLLYLTKKFYYVEQKKLSTFLDL
jgi:hypothetical protein